MILGYDAKSLICQKCKVEFKKNRGSPSRFCAECRIGPKKTRYSQAQSREDAVISFLNRDGAGILKYRSGYYLAILGDTRESDADIVLAIQRVLRTKNLLSSESLS